MSARACEVAESFPAGGMFSLASRLTAVIAGAALLMCMMPPAFAQPRSTAFVIPYTGTLK